MQQLLHLFDQHGPLLVFLNVLVEQLGAPVPAMPTLILAGALSVEGRFAWHSVLTLAVLASGIANFSWYLAGKQYGVRILGLACRVTLSPDACVRRTEKVFTRWGIASLLVARFVPGLSAVASPLAGAMGLPAVRFVFFDTVGTALWASAAMGAGALFHRQVDGLIRALAETGGGAILIISALLALYIAYRWIERQRLLRFVRRYRISAEELHTLLERGNAPVIVDVRTSRVRQEDPRRIPGALEADLDEVRGLFADVPFDQEIVFYCNCPNEASAAYAARQLQRAGFKRVRPLVGGLDGWISHAARVGHP